MKTMNNEQYEHRSASRNEVNPYMTYEVYPPYIHHSDGITYKFYAVIRETETEKSHGWIYVNDSLKVELYISND